MDAETAFLQGDIVEEIYMCLPESFSSNTNQVSMSLAEMFIWSKASQSCVK